MNDDSPLQNTTAVELNLLDQTAEIVRGFKESLQPMARQNCPRCHGKGWQATRPDVGRWMAPARIQPCGCAMRDSVSAAHVITLWQTARERVEALTQTVQPDIAAAPETWAAGPWSSSAPEAALRDGAVVARSSHTRQVVGSNPAPATDDHLEEAS